VENTILIKYGELFLKGKNKGFFERTLINNIKEKISIFGAKVIKISGRYFVCGYEANDELQIIEILTKIFGIHSVSPAKMFDTSLENITNYVSSLKFIQNTFRVTVKRADKSFPINSSEFASKMGGVILKNNNHLKVELVEPEVEVRIEIRENGKTFVYFEEIDGLNGMPVGTAGRGLLLLSGGIDSPVAGFNIAKRGMELSALHFHSYPYTSEQAKQKVLDLAKILSEYTGNIRVMVCGFTHAQEEIHKHCNEEYMITIMRRIMMRVAEKVCLNNGLQTIVTGESLGQVASQTIESMTVTNEVVKTLPVLRPLVAMDKSEITAIATKINTFKTSILPYEDCCTVFLPDHPVIKPKLEKVLKEESKLDIDALVEECINNIEIIETKDM
jgi:thiamine biosynthesis protein ThiI